ncbi:hypothetical Protein YC6258_01286 [Gynuella sunshinyii YC6258]|uniref:Uncharacterized protein n=1 Tax=Gynuella sunshinyii YC6258 TaxID=1445510 RepID=A0A0C5VSR0_9GAMM|nr:hypothetical Protein YC6258_01286 [Gynuella sunshinyii YC6258]
MSGFMEKIARVLQLFGVNLQSAMINQYTWQKRIIFNGFEFDWYVYVVQEYQNFFGIHRVIKIRYWKSR